MHQHSQAVAAVEKEKEIKHGDRQMTFLGLSLDKSYFEALLVSPWSVF